MKKISIKQKVMLLLFGFFLSLLLLELGLSAAGILLSPKYSLKNNVDFNNKNKTYIILALGESTTAQMVGDIESWPTLLEEILNNRSSKYKFRVINEGIPGTDSHSIALKLESNLEKYNPDIVITMIGINDKLELIRLENTFLSKIVSFFENFKIYKLIRAHIILKNENRDITGFEIENKNTAIDIDKLNSSDLANLGSRQYRKGEYLKAILTFEKLINKSPSLDEGYVGLGWTYLELDRLNRGYLNKRGYDKTSELFNRGIELNPLSYSGYLGLSWSYFHRLWYNWSETDRDIDRAIMALNKAIQIYPNEAIAYIALAKVYLRKGELKNFKGKGCLDYVKNISEKYLKKALAIDPGNKEAKELLLNNLIYCNQYKEENNELIDIIKNITTMFPEDEFAYRYSKTLYTNLNKELEAKAMKKRVDFLSSKKYNNITARNYLLIYNTLISRNITLFAMQYPMRDINDLKVLLKDKEDVIFVTNQENFEAALIKFELSDIFTDLFGGDFGHTTSFGSSLIAENAAKAILDYTEVRDEKNIR